MGECEQGPGSEEERTLHLGISSSMISLLSWMPRRAIAEGGTMQLIRFQSGLRARPSSGEGSKDPSPCLLEGQSGCHVQGLDAGR